MYIPKALNRHHFVAGQISNGWDTSRYGIPDEIISQVDRTTLFVLITTVEAFLQAGITDVYEVYRYIHVAELGNYIGSAIGGSDSITAIFKHPMLGREN